MDVLKQSFTEMTIFGEFIYEVNYMYGSKETVYALSKIYNMRMRFTYQHKRDKRKYRRKGTALRTLGFKRRQP